MTITVTGPLATPTTVVATPTAGGSLAASTTYYIRIVAKTGDSYYQSPFRDSAPSVEASFLTDVTNKQCAVTWDAVTGATRYDIYLSTVSGSYSGSKRIATANTTSTVATNSYTITGVETLNASVAPFTSAQTFPFSITKEGTIQVYMDGTVTLTDIYNAIVAAGFGTYVFWDGGTFVLNGHFSCTGSTAGSLTASRVTFHFLRGSGIVNSNANFTFTFGTANATFLDGTGGCTIYLYQDSARNFQGAKNLRLDGCVIKGGSNYLTGENYLFAPSQSYLSIGGTGGSYSGLIVVTGSSVVEVQPPLVTSDLYQMGNSYFAVGTGTGAGDNTHTRPNVRGSLAFYDLSAGANVYSVIDPIVYGGTQDIGYIRQNTKTINIYNGQWKNRADNIPYIYWLVLSGNTNNNWPVYLYYNLRLTVRDAVGAAVVGATVHIYDNTAAEVAGSPLTTDAYGVATLDLLCDTRTPHSSASSYIDSSNEGTHYSPHTVTITKAGYYTKTIIYTMDRKREEIEQLVPDGAHGAVSISPLRAGVGG